MVASSGKQFTLLLWKNWLIQKRKVAVSFFEVLLPVVFTALLIVIRLLVSTREELTTYYPAQSLNTTPEFQYPLQLKALALLKATNASASLPYWFPLSAISFGGGQPGIVGIIGYTPDTPLIKRIIERSAAWLDNKVEVLPFSSEEDMVFFMDSNQSAIRALGGVVFTNVENSSLPQAIQYKIRLNSTDLLPDGSYTRRNWRTDRVFTFNIGSRPRDGTNDPYKGKGFLQIQQAVDMSIILELDPTADVADYAVHIQRFPYPSYFVDVYVLIVTGNLPLFMILSFLLFALQIPKQIVYEKEKRLKEYMRMMGTSNWLYWMTWFLKCFIYILVAVAIMTVLFSLKVNSGFSVLGKSDASVMFIFLLIYGVATISFCFVCCVFFDNANAGAGVCGLLYFLTYVPWFFLSNQYENMTRFHKVIACLIPNLALSLGTYAVGQHMSTGEGVQWSNFNKPAVVDDDFSLADAMFMLLFDAVLGFLLTWYVEAVRPGKYGVPQPWYFCCTRSYWCGEKVSDDHDEEHHTQGVGQEQEFFEADPVGFNAGIEVKGLRKTFKGKKVAVAGMSVTMYENQVFALLGHNGAGKTTTMSMLTGFIPPSKGTAVVNGYDIRKSISKARESLGLCPQHDVLFEALTVEEHLEFYVQMKGVTGSAVKMEVDKTLGIMGMLDKRKSFPSGLSGGMKRKLSVGIALIGDSKIIMLDEPTSGMDPSARRQTWDIIQGARQGRTIVLTTHYMEEADLLGDRIAIMAEGELRCCGSSLFLKNKYGAGFHMVLVKEQACNIDAVTQMIQGHVPSSTLETDIGAELSYVLPREEICRFEGLFADLEVRHKDLGVSSFGVSLTTMEEVFLKVGEGIDVNEELVKSPSRKLSVRKPAVGYASLEEEQDGNSGVIMVKSNGDIPLQEVGGVTKGPAFNVDLKKNSGLKLHLQQLYAMLVKRALHTWRNRVVTLAQLLVPAIFTMLALALDLIPASTQSDYPALKMNTEMFGSDPNYIAAGYQPGDVVLSNISQKYGLNMPSNTQVQDVNAASANGSGDVESYLLQEADRLGIANYNKYFIAAASFDTNTSSAVKEIIAHSNGQPLHNSPIAVNLVTNTLLRYFVNESFSIEVTNHPLPFPSDFKRELQSNSSMLFGFLIQLCILFGMSYLASSFVVFLVRERDNNAKHLQIVSGGRLVTFWLSTFIWDLINYAIVFALIIIVFAAFQPEAYSQGGRLGFVALLLLLFPFGMLPLMYLLSFFFKTPVTASTLLTFTNILLGLTATLTVYLLDALHDPDTNTNTRPIAVVLDWIFIVLAPNYNLGKGLQDMYNNYQNIKLCTDSKVQDLCDLGIGNPCCKDNCGDNCLKYEENYLAWPAPGIGRMVIFLVVQWVFYFLILALLESEIISNTVYRRQSARVANGDLGQSGEAVDQDVLTEQGRVQQEIACENDVLVLKKLTKYYKNMLAVDHLSLGIPKGELFGLLGVNGAGKTTTFKMLTGDLLPSSGNALVGHYGIRDQADKVRQMIGYCPQFDALIEQMTARELLVFFARLRGISSAEISRVVDDILKALLIEEHADKQCGTYSGGNKRKLSTALALIGDPPVVFLDEPSTGLDPAARRKLWDTLMKVRVSGTTLVLTSHSMEECEALCTRLAIMVNGQFMCLGSVQHLKNRFGQGFTLLAKIQAPPSGGPVNVNPFMEFVQSTFPTCELEDVHQGYVQYNLPDTSLSWAYLFGTMEKAKPVYGIEDYSISQTTLEQVFLNFARRQRQPHEKKRGCCCF
ncbi:ATP-binding cassette sub-family A member 3 [Lingula anatina]|uniref:ATP-binding cassette sub-family A member 3 n=1 Tax=Lingula anatina TaxID=7574 RepID=A0A1S3JSD5_LINAN|nr:ATP-binding cassette sub-family A member 3 [Lingula anatina]|eukprot:XP_013413247.1 ATP-binding cassette sub-family A member 3 [Lingula anatina]